MHLFIFIVRMLWAFDIQSLRNQPRLRMEDKIFGFLHKPKPYRVAITYRSDEHKLTAERARREAVTLTITFDEVNKISPTRGGENS